MALAKDSELLQEFEVVKTYILDKPVKYAGETIYQLEFRELKTRDHLQVEEKYNDAGFITKGCAYLQRLTRQPMGVIENLSHKDYLACQEILIDFLKPDQMSTGET